LENKVFNNYCIYENLTYVFRLFM